MIRANVYEVFLVGGDSIFGKMKGKIKEISLVLACFVIAGMFFYYEKIQMNTSIRLYQKIGFSSVEYEDVINLFLKENRGNFTEKDFEEYYEFMRGRSPSHVQRFVVFNYEKDDQKVVIEVTPGINNMKILDVELKE